MNCVKIDVDTWLAMLDKRRSEIAEKYNWVISDCVYNYVCELLRESAEYMDPRYTDPAYIVDNLAVNGDWGEWEEYREDGETDEELVARFEDEAEAVFPEERMVLYSLGF